ncbi:hypothetical protein KC131_26250 [Pseudomonas sp. JQ170]|uniref:hypothetical protein n=1 Tax=unclassified Pseudomonas TaxID=196821 RepID=UPI00264E15DF|nr:MULTISPECIES: hypothetical protein [unclassified Pseudomonas]MDN7144153.1 hypothetical protein [Pseudomonas sp. JQ170]WRO77751.1 hypothetical protein U9R80_08760 [Pseudomonas sp. 170C]
MKIRALGPLSGASGDRVKGEEFEVDKAYGKGLVARGYAEEVTEKAEKPAKVETAKE